MLTVEDFVEYAAICYDKARSGDHGASLDEEAIDIARAVDRFWGDEAGLLAWAEENGYICLLTLDEPDA